jgi:tRNA nucleotidyltransferase/poly(A) polymerase
MVGDPIERFDEDSLRILRAFRFSSRYEHPLHKDTEAAIAKRKQLENIDPETGEMKRISQERVWEEVKKAWKQAKDFNFYLNFFTKFDMWDQVFPGSAINTDLVKSSDFVVVIANLFKNEPLNKLELKLVQDYKIESDTAKKVMFLLSFSTLTPETAFEMFKKKEQCFITDATILEWIKVSSINDPVKIKFLEYKPSTSAEELMDKGITGRDLGIKIKELEVENFKKLL